MGNGTISENDLMHKLVASKKVMNKVVTGDYEVGNIDPSRIVIDPEVMLEQDEPQEKKPNLRPVGTPDEYRIKQSKLPDVIKKAMIDTPISMASLGESLDMDLFKGAKRLMEQEGLISASPQPQQQQRSQPARQGSGVAMSASELTMLLTPIIENVVRKTLDEIVDRKLTQLLSAQQSATINENLAIKVGDSIFTGKITQVKSTK